MTRPSRLRAWGRPAAAYEWHRGCGEVVVVLDLDHPDCRSVTNDAEGVVADLAEWCPGALAATPLIAYRDTTGRWDALCVGPRPGFTFAGFKPLDAASEEEAVRLVLVALGREA